MSSSRRTVKSEPDEPPAPPQPPSRNYISSTIGHVKYLASPLTNKLYRLSQTARYVLIIISLPFIIFPAVWLLFLGPWILFILALIYSAIFGVSKFVTHFEEALREHFNVSDEVTLFDCFHPYCVEFGEGA